VSVDSESHSAFRVLHAVFQLSAFPQLAGFVLAGAALPVDYLALCASRDSRTRETASLPVSFVYSEFLDAAERRRSATVGEVHAPPERWFLWKRWGKRARIMQILHANLYVMLRMIQTHSWPWSC